MALQIEYYLRDCGCHEFAGEWRGEPREAIKPLKGLCHECRKERIGASIEFVRFGSVPAEGRSRNHRDGTDEAGVSVYEIKDGAIEFVGFHFDFVDRPAYRGTGVIVGWGSDGEPLVRPVDVRKLTKAQTEKLMASS